MTTEEALAEVHRHFCALDQHDDACLALQRWKRDHDAH